MSWSVSPQNIQAGGSGGEPLYCKPSQCRAYSSTGFEVAGLVLAATLNPAGRWYDFDLGKALFDDPSAYPQMFFPPKGQEHVKISKYLTVPGQSCDARWGC